jgi:hypothetical protein
MHEIRSDEAREGGPLLSVVLVAPRDLRNLWRVVEALRAQAMAARIELVLVVPEVAVVATADPQSLAGFAGVRTVAAGPVHDVDRAAVSGVRAAGASIVAIIEDHAYPAPGWAEAIVAAHASYDAVAPAILNANPLSLLSWSNHLLAYGRWAESSRRGAVDEVPGHNSSFSRDLLLSFGDRLEGLVGRDGGLMGELRTRGAKFGLEPGARVAHVNPSRLRSTFDLRFSAGRLYAARRARRERWSAAKRWIHALAWPLIPLVRMPRVRRELRESRGTDPDGRMIAALAIGLAFDALGQMAGYAAGEGGTAARLASFEMDRARHVTVRDRARFFS